MAVIAPIVAGCGNCAATCLPGPVVLLRTEGYVVVAATSSCENTSTAFDGTELMATPPASKMTCHVDVTLDDGEKLSFDVPFTKDVQTCCCGSCTTSVGTDWATVTITAPPGYVPHLDAGADGANEASLDAPVEGAPDAPADAPIDAGDQ